MSVLKPTEEENQFPVSDSSDGDGGDSAAAFEAFEKGTESEPVEAQSEEVVPEADADVTDAPTEPEQTEEAKEETKEEAPVDDLDAVVPPANLSQKNIVNFERLREVAKHHQAAANDYRTKFEQIQEQLKSVDGKLPAEVESELKELRDFRKVFDIQNDAEFKSKYDSSIESNSNEMEILLKRHGMPDETIKAIKENGGFVGADMKYWENEVLASLEASDDPEDNRAAVFIREKLRQNITLDYQKKIEIKRAAAGQSDYLQRKTESETKQKQADLGTMKQYLDSVLSQFPQVKLQEIPKGATPEQKLEIEESNKLFQESEQRLKIMLNPKADALTKIQTAVAANLSFYQQRDLERAAKKISDLESQIKKLRSVGTMTPSGAKPKSTASKEVSHLSDAEAAFEQYLKGN